MCPDEIKITYGLSTTIDEKLMLMYPRAQSALMCCVLHRKVRISGYQAE
jgi:hypothetical protein